MNDKRYFIDFSIKGVYNNNKYGYPDPLNAKYYEFTCHTDNAMEYAKEQFSLECEKNECIHITTEKRNEVYFHLHKQSKYSLIIS